MNFQEKNVGLWTLVAILLVLMMFTGSSWARGAYKWVDDNGVVHYSDRMRSNNNEASIINVKVKASAEDEADDESVAEKEAEEEAGSDKAKAVAAAEAAKKQKKVRKANCAKAREQLAANESMSRMYRVGKNGERQYLTDKERGDVIRRSLDSVKFWCD